MRDKVDSIIGPGLVNGVSVQAKNTARIYFSDCLLLNASQNNLSRISNSQTAIDMFRVTSYMTRLNKFGSSHAALNFTQMPGDTFRNSVFHGGVIKIISNGSNQLLGNYNMQFNTEGKTVSISKTLTNPQFQTNLMAIPNTVSVNTLMNTDFSLSDPSAVPYGLGSRVTSIPQLLSATN